MGEATKAITCEGVMVEVDASALDNVEFMEVLADIEEGNHLRFPKLCKLLFGDEGYRRLKADLADEQGVCSTSRLTSFVTRVMQEMGSDAKN